MTNTEFVVASWLPRFTDNERLPRREQGTGSIGTKSALIFLDDPAGMVPAGEEATMTFLERGRSVSPLPTVSMAGDLSGDDYRYWFWIGEHTEPKKNIVVTPSPRIGLSYYLTVSDKGEIIDSNPPMTKLGSHAWN